jgi:hypothetical protein
MRHLSVKQKRLLKEWYEKNKSLPGLGVCSWTDYDEFTLDFYNELVAINDFETLDSHIDNFIGETAMADLT